MIQVLKNLLLVCLLFLSNAAIAQSDYEMVQSFKERYSKLSGGIKSAASIDDLNNISTEIENLRRDFSEKKEILDQSLYPENFNSSFEALASSVELRRGDFTEIVGLQSEVVILKSEIDVLNKRNNELISQITVLESQRKKDAATINKLQNLVADLRATLIKRDELVLSIVDSLTPKLAGDINLMTEQDKEQITLQVQRNNVLSIVKKSLRDNSRFMELTSLKVDDIVEIKKQQQNFTTMWKKVGPKLVDVYAGKGEKTAELKEIDNLFNIWANKVKRETWESINEEFRLNNIKLQQFTNGNDFTNVIIQFISDEIKNYGVKSKEESEKVFSVFADSVWFKNISSEWMPYLIENNLLTIAQKDEIEKKISEWKSIVVPRDLTLLYVAVAAVFLIGLIIFLAMKKKKDNSTPTIVSENSN